MSAATFDREWHVDLKPPALLQVFAWIRGAVRKGMSDGCYFWLSDCTDPMQNAIARLDDVHAWALDPGKGADGRA